MRKILRFISSRTTAHGVELYAVGRKIKFLHAGKGEEGKGVGGWGQIRIEGKRGYEKHTTSGKFRVTCARGLKLIKKMWKDVVASHVTLYK